MLAQQEMVEPKQNLVTAIVFFIMIKEHCRARLQKFVVTSLYFKCWSKKMMYEKRRVRRTRRREGLVFSEGFFFLRPQTRKTDQCLLLCNVNNVYNLLKSVFCT